MSFEFEMINIWLMSYYLGLKMKQMEKEVFISQEKYSKEVLKKFNDCKPFEYTNGEWNKVVKV